MKNMKRAERRHKSKSKFERRLRIWVRQGMYDDTYDHINRLGGHEIEKYKDRIRNGEQWLFLRHTSTPCSCDMCSYPKYERQQKQYWFKDEDF